MHNSLTMRQPLFRFTWVGLCAASFILGSALNLKGAAAETPLAIGDQVTTLADLATLPNGHYQLCSEPEPDQFLGAGICYWFRKTGDQLVGYYGIPHSDIFIDCVSGKILGEKVVGDAIAVSWDGAPFPALGQGEPMTWKTLSLGPGKVEYQASGDRGEIAVIKFDQAELTLQGFYRYSPEKVKHMNEPPLNCSVQYWIDQVGSL